MIPHSHIAHSRGQASWQSAMADSIRSASELLDFVGLRRGAGAHQAERDFPVLVPRQWARRIRRGDARDPILLQVLAQARESQAAHGFGDDPLEERGQSPVPGLLHKYHGRALLMASGHCALNCRYCFRRSFPYQEHSLAHDAWDAALAWLAAERSISEVILSGGDPLSLGDRRLAAMADALAAIPHLRRLRVHSRLPVALPQRIDDGCLAWLAGGRLQGTLVLHINHANEISGALARAVHRLKREGVTVLNQSVLLAGVNDRPRTLIALSEALFAAGILPYYLHDLDPVAGAAHFAVSPLRRRRLVAAMHSRLPGYLVPRPVRETPGAPGKTPLA